MRVTKFAASAIAVVACGSVAVAVAGPSLAAVNAPDPDMSVVVPPAAVPKTAAAQQQLDAVGQLGEALTLFSRIGKEAQSKTPDVDALKEMQQRLQSATGRLGDSLRQYPPGSTGRPATDPVGDVQDLLRKLGAAVRKLVGAAERNDSAGVQAAINEALSVVKDLLAKLPLAGGGMPLPTPLPL
ncbi:hypothetical protein ACSNOH_19545 [Streptomyces sp. URMC 127]|uniref:hypothetical protein n=1 Tax=Streptomyces sp. URMC 127 TaxID=3423402 RepID=UPI003F1CF796